MRSYPAASACGIVDVARITSTTTPTAAGAASPGVKATWTGIGLRYFAHGRNRRKDLLPPPRPRHGPVVLGVRTAHLHGVHDDGAGRDPLPGALGTTTRRAAHDTGRPPRRVRGSRRKGDARTDRPEHPRVHRRARAGQR